MSVEKDAEQYRREIRLKAKNDYKRELTDSQVTMCIVTEESEGLSFFHNQIWPAPRDGAIKWEKTIDGFRVLAQRSGLCRVSEPEWVYDQNFTHKNKSRVSPDGLHACKISVWRRTPRGHVEGPFVGVAHYHEYVQLKKDGTPNRQWKTMPMNQLAAAAERQALRKAGLDHTTDVITDIADPVDGDVAADEPPVRADVPPVEPDLGAHSSDRPENVERPEPNAGPVKTISMPTDGWKAWDLLDDGRRIMRIGTGKDGSIRMALDDGHALSVKPVGDNRAAITMDRKRKDADKVPRGGFEWKKGDVYYDGATVTGVKNAKQDGAILLKLDSGFKVKVGQFGKELNRKKLEKKKDDVDHKSDPPSEGQRPSRRKDSGIALTDEEQSAYDLARDDARNIATDDQLKKAIRPLLARWCAEFNDGVRVSPKQGYKELLGVVLEPGQAMSHDDLLHFLEALAEALSKKVGA